MVVCLSSHPRNREDETIAENWKVLTTLQWELIQMCSNESVRQAATLCLALLGPIDANIVAFSSDQSIFLDDKSGALGDNVAFHSKLLSFLSKSITDVDVDVVSVAAKTLKAILSQKEGQKAFGVLSEIEKSYLFPFFVTEGRAKLNRKSLLGIGSSRLSEFGELQHAQLWSTELWTTYNKSFSSWIRLVTFRLTEFSSNCVLNSVSVMCLFKVEFASFVFPFAIRDYLSNEGDETPLLRFFMDCIVEKENVEVLLQILGCLQFLRFVFLIFFFLIL